MPISGLKPDPRAIESSLPQWLNAKVVLLSRRGGYYSMFKQSFDYVFEGRYVCFRWKGAFK